MNQESQKYSIGQVVYILSEKGQNIIPAMIVEEQTIQRLNGVSVSWKVAIGPSDKQKVVDSTELKGDIYTSLLEIKSLLSKRLNEFIENTTEMAKKREASWYGAQKKAAVNPSLPQDETGKIDPDSFLNDFDGEEPKSADPAFTKNLKKATMDHKEKTLQATLKERIMPSREELEADPETGELREVDMIGPDGRPMVARVRSPI